MLIIPHFYTDWMIANRTLQTLHAVLTSPDLTQKQKTTIYKSPAQSQLLYACPVWGYAANTHIHKLRVIQNRAACKITGTDMYTGINQLHEMLNITTLDNKIKEITKKLKDTYTDHQNTLIRGIGHVNTIIHYITERQ